MPDGSEFQTAGTATLKPPEVKVVQTRGTDNRLVFAERRERVGVCELFMDVSLSEQYTGLPNKNRTFLRYSLKKIVACCFLL